MAILFLTLDGAISALPADSLVIAETPRPVTDLAAALTAAGVEHHVIGDAVAAKGGAPTATVEPPAAEEAQQTAEQG